MTQPAAAFFAEIVDHPGFQSFLDGIRNELTSVTKQLETYDGKAGFDFAMEIARLQGMARQLRWVLEEYPKRLTGAYDDEHPVATGGEDAYETPAGTRPFAD